MRLRFQLLLVSLCLLLLPWGAWQYLKAVDIALRKSQEQSLFESARLLADRFSFDAYLLDEPFVGLPKRTSLQSFSDKYTSLYAYPLSTLPVMDGYSDEWRNQAIDVIQTAVQIDNDFSMDVQIGEYENKVYFYLNIYDEDIRYYNPSIPDAFATGEISEDHLRLTIYDASHHAASYRIRTSAPSRIDAHYYDQVGVLQREHLISGVWRESQQGYHVELSVDKQLLRHGFLLEAVNHNASGAVTRPQNDNIVGLLNQSNSVARLTDKPIWLTMLSNDIQSSINAMHAPSLSIKIINPQKWLVASMSAQQQKIARDVPWLVEWFYRQLLEAEKLPLRNRHLFHSYSSYKEVELSQQEGASLQWYRSSRPFSRQTLASVAHPIYDVSSSRLQGYLLIEKTTDQLVALTTSAFSRLFLYTVGTFLVVVLLLFSYANWLSFRIQRLYHAVTGAVNETGGLNLEKRTWPESDRKDELGELSRSYRDLLLQQQEYNHYLRTLSSKLSHELRTPIAVVKSSLENMRQVKNTQSQHQYNDRAQEGLQRLNHILNAMSSASSVEESIRLAEFEQIDLKEFLSHLTIAYNDAYTDYTIVFSANVESAFAMVAQELFVQMMDKLIDNAVDFSSTEDDIVIGLYSQKDTFVITVENIGPVLPDVMNNNVFESMVSLRSQKETGKSVHLGLGLYIARLIADCHSGEISAQNRWDDRGVVFSVFIPQ